MWEKGFTFQGLRFGLPILFLQLALKLGEALNEDPPAYHARLFRSSTIGDFIEDFLN